MAATFNSTQKIEDSRGFHYQVNVEHHPQTGISFANYMGTRISRFEYGRWLLPQGDDDGEWEQFEERFMEGPGGDALCHFEHDCKLYFDNQNKNR